jgi:hypothetical protein
MATTCRISFPRPVLALSAYATGTDRRLVRAVSCGAGAVDVVQTRPAYVSIARTQTRSGARTSLFVPELDRLFVAARAGGSSEAAVLVYRPRP